MTQKNIHTLASAYLSCPFYTRFPIFSILQISLTFSISWINQVCSHLRVFHLQFPLPRKLFTQTSHGWIILALQLSVQFSFLRKKKSLNTLNYHFLSHCSHSLSRHSVRVLHGIYPTWPYLFVSLLMSLSLCWRSMYCDESPKILVRNERLSAPVKGSTSRGTVFPVGCLPEVHRQPFSHLSVRAPPEAGSIAAPLILCHSPT